MPVRIKDVVDTLEESADFAMHFLDKRTGEIVLVTDEEWEAAETDKTFVRVSRMAARRFLTRARI